MALRASLTFGATAGAAGLSSFLPVRDGRPPPEPSPAAPRLRDQVSLSVTTRLKTGASGVKSTSHAK